LKIGNFNIEQQNGNTVVNYRRTVKDWIDIFVYLFLGLAASAFIVKMFQYADFQTWIFWVMIALFSFFALLKLTDGFTRLTQSTKSIILINYAENKLIAKYPYMKKTIINLEDIVRIQLSGVNERIRMSKTTQVRTYSKIEVLDRYGELHVILLINTKQLFRISTKMIETEVYDTGQKLAKILSEQTKAEYQWTGFHTTSV
jgi:hypothetical protein